MFSYKLILGLILILDINCQGGRSVGKSLRSSLRQSNNLQNSIGNRKNKVDGEPGEDPFNIRFNTLNPLILTDPIWVHFPNSGNRRQKRVHNLPRRHFRFFANCTTISHSATSRAIARIGPGRFVARFGPNTRHIEY